MGDISPKDDVWFRNGRMGREEGDYGVGVGGRDGGEEGGGVKGASVEEVGGFYGTMEVSNPAYLYKILNKSNMRDPITYVGQT